MSFGPLEQKFRAITGCVFVLVFVGACSSEAPDVAAGSDAPAATSAPVEAPTAAPTAAVDEEIPTVTAASSNDSTPIADSTPVADSTAIADSRAIADDEPAPLRPYGEVTPAPDTGEPSTSVYVTRTSMTSDEIRIKWSAPEGAAEYQLHRVIRDSASRPEVDAMTEDSFVGDVEFTGTFEDDSVEEGTLYWYGVRGLAADGTLLSHGWHLGYAVDDTESPTMVGDITAVLSDGEIVISWSRPTDNYQLHAYRVYRAIEGGKPEGVVATWDLDQTSFVDDPAVLSGEVTYSVIAFDVHWNQSDPATVVVTVS